MSQNQHDKQALDDFVGRLCTLATLKEMREYADEEYYSIKTGTRPKGSVAVEVFIASVLRAYLANPAAGFPNTPRSAEFSHELATIRIRLRKLGLTQGSQG
jgi:hypothetical protein